MKIPFLKLESEADYPPPRFASPKMRKHLLFLLVVATVLSVVALSLRVFGSQERRLSAILDELYAASEVYTAPIPADTGIEHFETAPFVMEDSFTGPLILVNRANPLQSEPVEENLVKLLSLDGSDYYVKDWTVRLQLEAAHALEDALSEAKELGVSAKLLADRAYRTLAEQRSVYENYYDLSADESCPFPEDEVLLVCLPGASDYHTALSVHLSLYGGGEVGEMNNYATLLDTAARFGFVLRYPKDKEEITFVTSNEGQFRYVGKVHADYMVRENLCLEEYIDLLKEKERARSCLRTTFGGKEYAVYRVTLQEEGETLAPLPTDLSYGVSGDNCGGLIFTVCLEQATE